MLTVIWFKGFFLPSTGFDEKISKLRAWIRKKEWLRKDGLTSLADLREMKLVENFLKMKMLQNFERCASISNFSKAITVEMNKGS